MHKKDMESSDQASPLVVEEYLELCDDDDKVPELVITCTTPPSRRYLSHSHNAQLDLMILCHIELEMSSLRKGMV